LAAGESLDGFLAAPYRLSITSSVSTREQGRIPTNTWRVLQVVTGSNLSGKSLPLAKFWEIPGAFMLDVCARHRAIQITTLPRKTAVTDNEGANE
jgi:hypothetical protein